MTKRDVATTILNNLLGLGLIELTGPQTFEESVQEIMKVLE